MVRIRETWVLAVRSEMTRSRAIWRLEWPRASSRRTSSSRSVSSRRAAGVGRGSGRLVARSRTSRRAVGGEVTVNHTDAAVRDLRALLELGVAREKLIEIFGFSGLSRYEKMLAERAPKVIEHQERVE